MKNKISLKMNLAFLATLVLSVMFILCIKPFESKAAENKFMLNVNEVSIAKDSVFKLRTYNVPQNTELKFKSSDISVAFVDQKGRITGISCGECVVTVTVQTKNHTPIDMCTCNVTVGPAAISIKFTKTEMVLSVGMKKLLKSIVSPLNTVESPLFYSSDKDVASVTAIGRVRAKGVGEAVIYAFLMNGESAECQVYVLSEEQYAEYKEKGNLEEILENSSDDGEDIEDPDETDTKDGSEEDGKADKTGNKTEKTEKNEKTDKTDKTAKTEKTE